MCIWQVSRVLCAAMPLRSRLLIGPVLLALICLAGCASGGTVATTPPTITTPTTQDADWPPVGMTAWDQSIAFKWTPIAEVKCKSFQDGGCYGITITSKYACPSGIYVEVAIVDASGASIDKANDITAAGLAGGTVKTVLSPPGGAPSGAKARVSKLNCLGA